MRATLLSWLPVDLRRTKVLDAGCGTGALAVAAACRGADVTGIDVAAGLVEVARSGARSSAMGAFTGALATCSTPISAPLPMWWRWIC